MADDAGVQIPDWPEGTACVLATGGGPAHAIPVSTAVKRSDTTVVLGLGRRRESLARLKDDPRVALCVLAGPNLAFTLTGSASVVDEDVAGVVAVRLEVDEVEDHMTPDFEISDGVAWRWTDEAAAARDDEVRSGLRHLDA
jgi:hypothetical protein